MPGPCTLVPLEYWIEYQINDLFKKRNIQEPYGFSLSTFWLVKGDIPVWDIEGNELAEGFCDMMASMAEFADMIQGNVNHA